MNCLSVPWSRASVAGTVLVVLSAGILLVESQFPAKPRKTFVEGEATISRLRDAALVIRCLAKRDPRWFDGMIDEVLAHAADVNCCSQGEAVFLAQDEWERPLSLRGTGNDRIVLMSRGPNGLDEDGLGDDMVLTLGLESNAAEFTPEPSRGSGDQSTSP